MHFLLTNDDGIHAPGMAALIEAVAPLADLTIVAPLNERSAISHAIAVFRPLLLEPQPHRVPGGRAWALDANPADCVKYALTSVLVDQPPDLVISGINRGQNAGTNILYSGTVAGAMEGALNGVPSIAISISALFREEADFSGAQEFIARVAPQVAEQGLPPWVMLNINVPSLPPERIQGARWARQGEARYTDLFEILPEDNPREGIDDGQRMVSNTGADLISSEGEDTDDRLLAHGFIALTPLTCDRTAHAVLRDPPPLEL
ncbi:5'/3'-nucleotidase SurE [Candidatus Sumerlaeota bacterium]|nr:5'/3'-nucleotidase SurE [Candidatus Sumerlaeota bacterium]